MHFEILLPELFHASLEKYKQTCYL